jgi:hypothetical protein
VSETKPPVLPPSPCHGLSYEDYNALMTWTEECERGIVHTATYDAAMAGLQRLYDAAMGPQGRR